MLLLLRQGPTPPTPPPPPSRSPAAQQAQPSKGAYGRVAPVGGEAARARTGPGRSTKAGAAEGSASDEGEEEAAS